MTITPPITVMTWKVFNKIGHPVCLHQENMSMKSISPYTSLLYIENRVYRGIFIFSSPEPKAHKVSL